MNIYQHGEYFNWLCSIVGADYRGPFYNYRDLLERLFQTTFNAIRYMDDNRAMDGIYLRYYFEANRYDYASNDVAPYHIAGTFYQDTRDEPCSMLEMMISFSKQIDTQFLHSSESRVFMWFWIMVESMGLARMIDNYWNKDDPNSDVEIILDAFNKNAIQYFEDYSAPTVLLFPIKNIQNHQGEIRSLWDNMLIWYNQNGQYLDELSSNQFINIFTQRYGCV